MITAIVSTITGAFSHPSVLAFVAALLWGVLSVLLSPCHLGAIPLIVAYVNEGKRPDRRKAFFYSILFSLGLLAMLAVVGVVTSAAGRLLGDVGRSVTIAISLFLVLCGLWLMDIPPFSKISFSFNVMPERRGPLGAFILGLVYGVILGPCTFAFLAPMLGFVFSAGRGEVAFGISLMIFYAAGHTFAIVAAGTFGDYVGELLRKRGTGTAGIWFKRFCGLIVAIAGVLQIV